MKYALHVNFLTTTIVLDEGGMDQPDSSVDFEIYNQDSDFCVISGLRDFTELEGEVYQVIQDKQYKLELEHLIPE